MKILNTCWKYSTITMATKIVTTSRTGYKKKCVHHILKPTVLCTTDTNSACMQSP